jgi:DNA-binding transcriptional regulator YhcF (GntR family)
MSQQVDAILSQIERLDDEDRQLLQQRLAELAEAEWQAESTKARAMAVDLGINQETIDRAVDDLRYGS